jgi:hypothetical protein
MALADVASGDGRGIAGMARRMYLAVKEAIVMQNRCDWMLSKQRLIGRLGSKEKLDYLLSRNMIHRSHCVQNSTKCPAMRMTATLTTTTILRNYTTSLPEARDIVVATCRAHQAAVLLTSTTPQLEQQIAQAQAHTLHNHDVKIVGVHKPLLGTRDRITVTPLPPPRRL